MRQNSSFKFLNLNETFTDLNLLETIDLLQINDPTKKTQIIYIYNVLTLEYRRV